MLISANSQGGVIKEKENGTPEPERVLILNLHRFYKHGELTSEEGFFFSIPRSLLAKK